MAMLDYGAVVKKNGVIIADPKGGLFQNFTNLKYEVMKEEPYDTLVDETVVRCEPTKDDDWKPFNYSFGGNYFAVIGDAHLMIGFYKTSLGIAIDKVKYNYPYVNWTHQCRPKYISVNKDDRVLTTIKISKIDEESQVFLATFVYNGDKYEVLYGYGIDPSLNYTFSSRNYYTHKRKDYWCKRGTWFRRGGYKFRKLLKFIRKWTYDGLPNEDKAMVREVYKYYD